MRYMINLFQGEYKMKMDFQVSSKNCICCHSKASSMCCCICHGKISYEYKP